MKCKLCRWLCNWLECDDSPVRAAVWKQSEAWERAHSNEYELWSAASNQERERLVAARALQSEDPEAAFKIYLELADAGVAWAMEVVAYQYGWGTLVANDFEQAQAYYRRAIEAGSWMATSRYARLLARHGHLDFCETLLEDGVRADFVPAYYWLARCRLARSDDRPTCREIRPLLEHAAKAGHPAAALLLAQLKVRRKFGFRGVAQGIRELVQIAGQAPSIPPLPDSGQLPAAVA